MIRPTTTPNERDEKMVDGVAPLVKVVVKVGNVSISRSIALNEVDTLGLPALVNRLKFGVAA